MQGRITPWCIYDFVKTDEDIKNFLEAALETDDNETLRLVVGDVIKILTAREEKHKKRNNVNIIFPLCKKKSLGGAPQKHKSGA